MGEWLYECSADDLQRYVLGTIGESPLICFGVNPSAASPEHLDPTMRSVASVAEHLGYDSYIMLNLYPQRAADPDDMDLKPNPVYVDENHRQIEKVLKAGHRTIWAAWGTLIRKRLWLPGCLENNVTFVDDGA